ncbi:sigma 54-interacting transcriptional regulator [Candidatus Binatia bacterium]|nr:sigma 54-interacting transcriptional regulator [Candidatus Binatia bacterium]
MERARLIIERAGAQPFEVELAAVATIGRGPTNDVALDDPAASRRQSIVRADEDGFLVSDLGSANGTFLNGTRVLAPARLKTGDEITVGSTRIRFVGDPSRESHAEQPADDSTRVREDARSGGVLLGASPEMEQLFHLIEKAAASPLPTLIEGETGTGKELVARAIHQASRSAKGPFLPVNCAAVPENLLESELFGHRRGAFTGAVGDHEGLFEAAQGGTVFLDEIGEMPLAMQPKVLRVLQEGEVTRIGEIRPRKVDFRLVAATNRDLLQEVERGAFRGDLFYRISAFPIRIPALRERRSDVALLVESFLAVAARRQGKRVGPLTDAAMRALIAFDWPGNVRELQNEVQRAVALATPGQPIDVGQLSPKLTGGDEAADTAGERTPTSPGLAASPGSLREARDAFESRFIAQVLEQQGGSVLKAARVLGLTRAGLYKKLKEFGLR